MTCPNELVFVSMFPFGRASVITRGRGETDGVGVEVGGSVRLGVKEGTVEGVSDGIGEAVGDGVREGDKVSVASSFN